MIKLNVHEAKTYLSRYLERLARGESIILCKRNIPIAEIRPIAKPRTAKRPVGLAKGKFKLSRKFFKSLPADILESFYGEEHEVSFRRLACPGDCSPSCNLDSG
jgi:antitoxin (DNA-binding transcriptional repressor) of toxin-antitoxin stability system